MKPPLGFQMADGSRSRYIQLPGRVSPRYALRPALRPGL